MNQESISVTYIGTTCNIQHRRIHHPVRKVTHSTTQNSGVAGRGGARGGDDGLRNYECFPSSHLPHAKCSPWKGKTACKMLPLERKSTAACEMLPPGKEIHSRMRNAPPGKEIHSRMRNAPLERKSTAACEMPPWKGNPQPHAKCSLPERDSLPINFMLE